jgi:4-aminobutyrate aminotransferase-like enzyme
MILLPAGNRGEVIEIVPPFTISDDQIDWCINALDRILGALAA